MPSTTHYIKNAPILDIDTGEPLTLTISNADGTTDPNVAINVAGALRLFCLNIPRADLTMEDSEKIRRILGAVRRARQENANYVALHNDEHGWVMEKLPKYARIVFGAGQVEVRDALKEELRPEQREPKPGKDEDDSDPKALKKKGAKVE